MLVQKVKSREIVKVRESARGEQCTMESPMCNFNPETVVWCHSDYSEHGRGMGFKSFDIFGFYGCSGCNAWYDTHSKAGKLAVSEEDRRWYYQRAHDRSLLKVLEKGVLR